MLVIKLILAIAAIAAIVMGIRKFDQHCTGKFGHGFFTKAAFYLTATAQGLFVVGSMWRQAAVQSNGDEQNGAVLMLSMWIRRTVVSITCR